MSHAQKGDYHLIWTNLETHAHFSYDFSSKLLDLTYVNILHISCEYTKQIENESKDFNITLY